MLEAFGGLTNFGDDTGEDDMLLARRLYGGTKISVVPGVNFALSVDEGGVWVEGNDFFW